MAKEYIVELRDEEADELMNEHWVGELVRCRYCKHRQSMMAVIINGQVCFWCEMAKAYRPDEWYCADGERR